MFWPGEFCGLYSPWGLKELDTAERLSLSLYEHRPGEQQLMKISKISRNICKTVVSAKDLSKAGEEDGEMGVGSSDSILYCGVSEMTFCVECGGHATQRGSAS